MWMGLRSPRNASAGRKREAATGYIGPEVTFCGPVRSKIVYMRPLTLLLCASLLWATAALWAQSYKGPVPPKPDVPYLLHASTLVEVETTQAKKETKKNETVYSIAGEASPARTPLAEPIFLILTDKIKPEKIELYQFEVKKGRRELTLKANPGRNDTRPLHLSVKKLDKNLYRVEASEVLENGEYSLSPADSDDVFSFQVY
jgi:hypothetical protein